MPRSEYIRELIPDLKPVEVFDFYDEPTFYSCQDKTGQLFIVYWADEENESKSWLYIKISKERYVQLKNGNITIFSALSQPEEGFAYLVKAVNSDYSVSQLECASILTEWLPPPRRQTRSPHAEPSGKTQLCKGNVFCNAKAGSRFGI